MRMGVLTAGTPRKPVEEGLPAHPDSGELAPTPGEGSCKPKVWCGGEGSGVRGMVQIIKVWETGTGQAGPNGDW